MKKTIPVLLVLSLMVVFTTCKKWEGVQEETPEAKILVEGSYSPGFSWETAKNITLHITSADSEIITINSEEGDIRYYRGMHPGQNEIFKVCLNLPVDVEKLRVNNREVSITSEPMPVNLND